jgi:carboxypeptidase PM20D1
MTEDHTTNAYVRTTTAVTMFNAGVKENVVPQRAEARVNFRLLPGDTPDMVVERITEIVADPSISIRYDNWDRIAPVADYRGSGFDTIRAAVAEVYPEALVVPTLLVATTDTRHYIDVADDIYRFHGAMIPMSDTSGIHGTNERIGVESFQRTVEIATHMIRKGSL